MTSTVCRPLIGLLAVALLSAAPAAAFPTIDNFESGGFLVSTEGYYTGLLTLDVPTNGMTPYRQLILDSEGGLGESELLDLTDGGYYDRIKVDVTRPTAQTPRRPSATRSPTRTSRRKRACEPCRTQGLTRFRSASTRRPISRRCEGSRSNSTTARTRTSTRSTTFDGRASRG